jgi:GR25 family glycosyltransferase involved in LPS biosynthesis
MIPKTIYFCYKSLDAMKTYTDNWQKLNPEYDIRSYDNQMCEQFLLDEFGVLHKDIFNFLRDGPIKADFWRICILYKYGGIYSDIDNVPLLPIRDFLEPSVDFATCSSYWDEMSMKFNPNFIVSTKGNVILEQCIAWYVNNYNNNKPYEYWKWSIMQTFTDILCLDNYNNSDGIYQLNGMAVQIMKECPGKNHYDAHNIYKGMRIFNNRYSNWDWINHTFFEVSNAESTIKYYLIHCPQHAERINHITTIIKQISRPIEIFDGIYTADIELSKQNDVLQSYDKKLVFNVRAGSQYLIYEKRYMLGATNSFKFYLPGQIGCYLSHHMIIKQIVDNKMNNKNISDYTVIFEDDVQFSSHIDLHGAIMQAINDMRSAKIDFDIIYLGSLNENHGRNVINNIYRLDDTVGCFGTHALLINNANIEKIYQSNCNIIHAIDNQYYFNIVNKMLNGFVVYPSICGQTSDLRSNIDRNEQTSNR